MSSNPRTSPTPSKPHASRVYTTARTARADFQESQRFCVNRKGLQALAELIQQQDVKAYEFLKEDGAMKKMWMREMAGLEEKVGGWEKEMDGIEWEIEESFRNEDQG